MDLTNKLIDLRIMLTSNCDGFSQEKASKNTMLSSRIKILHILSDKDANPIQLIDSLCMAKSNLANLLKLMIRENVILGYKNIDNSKNMYYRITEKGLQELNSYKKDMREQFRARCTCSEEELQEKLDEILKLLKGNKND